MLKSDSSIDTSEISIVCSIFGFCAHSPLKFTSGRSKVCDRASATANELLGKRSNLAEYDVDAESGSVALSRS